MFQASACAKTILLGEHAVVYGQPALAVPVAGLLAKAEALPAEKGFFLEAPAIGLASALEDLPPDHPLAFCVRHTIAHLQIPLPSVRLRIQSEIPVASGLGSGAAVSTAIIRALAALAGRTLAPVEISALSFEVERIHHGTPSGVDNTVIAFERPILFRRGADPQFVHPGSVCHFLIAYSGIRGETRSAVAGVRERREREPALYDNLFREIGSLAEDGCDALQSGDSRRLGRDMNNCHGLLQAIGVSLPALDQLTDAARAAGALGAKLSGAGAGGNVLVLANPERREEILAALQSAGSRWEFAFTLPAG
jgi:mevalonate kinase